MRIRTVLLIAAAILLPAGGVTSPAPAQGPAFAQALRRGEAATIAQVETAVEEAHAAFAPTERSHVRWPEERRLFAAAARTAWSFVEAHYQPGTGLVAPVADYPIATMWDIGSMLAAFYSAHGLGLIDDGAYESRMRTVLATLAHAPLYDGAVFNRTYHTRTGRMIVRRGSATHVVGWSTTDLGRLLIWLKIVGADPAFRDVTDAIVRRIDLARAIDEGYLWGEDVGADGKPYRYQEGRLGYEQYAAQGFALWGHRAEKALSLTENAAPMSVLGQAIPADLRRWDRLTIEPFLLLGLELGWDRPTAALARRLVLVQEARYRKTGEITITGEDAIALPPHYFYYYCIYANGKQFAVDVQDQSAVADRPRWVSAKSAFALHALMPSRYSTLAVEQLSAADGAGGWASGVYEGTGRSTGTANINTAAVILSAALVYQRGEPLLAQAQRDTTPRARGSSK